MGKSSYLPSVPDAISRCATPLPGVPLVEVCNSKRILIENHQGVAAYGKDRILIHVRFGAVCVCGCNLEIVHMTKEQLIICGRIDSVALQRRR